LGHSDRFIELSGLLNCVGDRDGYQHPGVDGDGDRDSQCDAHGIGHIHADGHGVCDPDADCDRFAAACGTDVVRPGRLPVSGLPAAGAALTRRAN
jgi:hypothetical protein